VQTVIQIAAQGVPESAECMESCVVEFVEVLNLLEQLPLLDAGEAFRTLGFRQNAHQDTEEIQIAFRRWQSKWIDLEIAGFQPHLEV
jgi:hypothetical protein